MRTRQLASGTQRTFVLVCEKGDDPVKVLTQFARDHDVTAASFTAIGAFADVTLGYFDRDRMDYRHNDLHEQVEVLSCIGDIAVNDGAPAVHAHVVVGRADASTAGGHLLHAEVWPTLEIVLTETSAELRKTTDAETGLALIDVARSRVQLDNGHR